MLSTESLICVINVQEMSIRRSKYHDVYFTSQKHHSVVTTVCLEFGNDSLICGVLVRTVCFLLAVPCFCPLRVLVSLRVC